MITPPAFSKFVIDPAQQVDAPPPPPPVQLTDMLANTETPIMTFSEWHTSTVATSLAMESGRTITELTYHDWYGRLYFGYGDWNNNSGPHDLAYVSTDDNPVETVYWTQFDSESSEVIRVDPNRGAVIIPQIDPRTPWTGQHHGFLSDVFGEWKMVTGPSMVHVLDALYSPFDDRFYMVGAQELVKGQNKAVVYSTQDGETWTEELSLTNNTPTGWERFYSITEVNSSFVPDTYMMVGTATLQDVPQMWGKKTDGTWQPIEGDAQAMNMDSVTGRYGYQIKTISGVYSNGAMQPYCDDTGREVAGYIYHPTSNSENSFAVAYSSYDDEYHHILKVMSGPKYLYNYIRPFARVRKSEVPVIASLEAAQGMLYLGTTGGRILRSSYADVGVVGGGSGT